MTTPPLYKSKPIPVPSIEQLKSISDKYNIKADNLEEYQKVIGGLLESYAHIEEIYPNFDFSQPSVEKYPRSFGRKPTTSENPLNAISWLCTIKGASEGKLAGRNIIIKDNVAIAGIPMANGSRVLETYIPDHDATIVARLLDAGATIIAKTVCEDLCLSGSSFTSATGPVLNPNDVTRATGGSSSGSAALVAAGMCDLAIGGDQGGSLRIPPAWCGVVGLKPTWGLIPYTGVFPLEVTVDHAGPITKTVRDSALLLEVLAGPDGLDPRQNNVCVPVEGYVSATDDVNVSGMRVAVLKEGLENIEADVLAVFEEAVEFIKSKLNCQVTEVSVNLHKSGVHIWNTIGIEGIHSMVFTNNSQGNNAKGFYSPQLAQQFNQGFAQNGDLLSATNKLVIMTGDYIHSRTAGKYYCMGQNMSRALKRGYDEVLASHDVLIMPTVPTRAHPLLTTENYSVANACGTALGMICNTASFNVTGHPAITVDARISPEEKAKLPVGLMIVGKFWDERTILKLAHSFSTQTQ